MAMLQRRVEKLIVFVDSETVLPKTADHVMKNSDITPLFGLENEGMPNNQVFPTSDYHTLLSGLVSAQQAGGLAMHAMTHTTVENNWFGIKPRCDVYVLWVYTAPVNDWLPNLSVEVQQAVNEGIGEEGPLAYFPNFRTFDENELGTINLTKEQAALIADMYAWSIEDKPSIFQEILTRPI